MISAGRAAMAEAYGTFLLVLLGPMSITIAAISGFGGFPSLGFIGLAHGLGVLVSVYSFGRVSGAHINPAVTIAHWATRRIDSRRVAPYIIAQFIGATAAAFLQLAIIGPELARQARTNLGNTAPPTTGFVAANIWNVTAAALLAEIVGTAILVFTVFAVTEKESTPGWAGMTIGLVLAGIIWVFGPISGASLNPARTWGPSLASLTFNLSVFDTYWIYVVGPVIGGLIGGFLYDVMRPK